MKLYRKIMAIFVVLTFILAVRSDAFSEGDIIEFNGIKTSMPKIYNGEDMREEDPKYLNKNEDFIYSVNLDSSISEYIREYETDGTRAVGIDVSSFQKEIDWATVAKAGVKFAIIRCGGRGYGNSSGRIYRDEYCERNIQEAINNGIFVGVYFYSAAINEQEALEEAAYTVDIIKKYAINYPVVYDIEKSGAYRMEGYRTDATTKEQVERNARVFLDYVRSQGYTPALYSFYNFMLNVFNENMLSSYDVWMARYNTSGIGYSGKYTMWQCTESASVPGIQGGVDTNIDYTYYKRYKEVPFIDIGDSTSWCYNAIKYCYSKNIVSGFSKAKFGPDEKITRGQFITFLWRKEGSPKVNAKCYFSDVFSESYYYDAINWAYEKGIISGYGDGKFAPNNNINRQQLAVMLCNYAKYKEVEIEANILLDDFKDAYSISDYAIPSIRWAVNNAIIGGKNNEKGAKYIKPVDFATRAEATSMLYNYCTKISR